jgi:hypothetical protein
MEPSAEQVDRAVAALALFVHEWRLPLNPDDLAELAHAVLTHGAFGSTSYEQIDADVRGRIEVLRRVQLAPRPTRVPDVHSWVLGEINSRFDRPLIENSFRGRYVELMVGCILGDEWTSTGDDWGPYDFASTDGIRLEIKQSTAAQSWNQSVASVPRFDIAARKGSYDGNEWKPGLARNADVHLFAWHPGFASAMVDHRDPGQWEFYVIASVDLPDQASIGLSGVRQRPARQCTSSNLREIVDQTAASCREPRSSPPSSTPTS